MKKAVLIGIFSLMAFAPVRCALAQAGTSDPAAKALDKSSAAVSATTDNRKLQDPAPEAVVANTPAKNSTDSPKTTEATDSTSGASNNAATEAQKRYDTGLALYESGKLDEAIAALKEANKLKPNDPQTQYILGMVYYKSKAYYDAADYFKRAVKLKPDLAEAYFQLGLASYVLGKKKQSVDAYNKLVLLNSPLAAALYRINNDANSAKVGEDEITEPTPSNAKQEETVPVSVRTASAPANQESSPPVADSQSTTTTALSHPEATATAVASGDPLSSNSAVVTPDSVLTEIYKVGVGDVLDIRLLNSTANRSTLYSVADSGVIDLPIAVSPLLVAGLTTKEIQERIKSEMKRLAVKDAEVTVAVRQYGSHSVIITGLVASPGTKTLRREAVPLYVLLAEVQPRPDAGRVAIMRAGVTGRTLDISESEALNFLVRPGDVISVTARPQEFYYISGRINYPGQKVFQPGITLFQAILAAGGLARDNSVEVSREGADGRLATTKLKLKEIKSGKIEDPRLQPGDRVEVH